MLLEQYKIHCSDLIKARLRGILVRKNVRKELYLMKKARNKIFKHILALRTILILKSNTIQNLLIDIANIKCQLKNLDEKKDNTKIKELKNKLSKNINLFYDTYYYSKENCNWIIENKIQEKWSQKFFDIINKKTVKKEEKNRKIVLSENNGNNNYLYEFYHETEEDNSKELNNNFLSSNKISNFYSTMNSTKKSAEKRIKFLKIKLMKQVAIFQNLI